MEKNNNLIYWKCGYCNSIHISNKKTRHQMDYCECGKTALDAEEFYSRGVGKVEIITKQEYEKNNKQRC